jgi:hypothetical protein
MAITNGYCSLNEMKAALRITDSVDDELLELSINAASRQIDGYCERVFYSTTTTRIFAPQTSTMCEIDDLVSITHLKTSSDGDGAFDITWGATDYQLEPLNQLNGGIVSPYTRIRAVGDYLFPEFPNYGLNHEATVQVAGVFGYSASVPDAIKQACIILAMRQFKRYDSPLGVAGFADIGVIRVSRVDPDIAALLEPFMKLRLA